MKQSILQFESHICMEHLNTYRAVFKTKHGRVLYLELGTIDDEYVITDCFILIAIKTEQGLNDTMPNRRCYRRLSSAKMICYLSLKMN